MALYKVTSEIHTESNDSTLESTNNHVTKSFSFAYPAYLSKAKNQSLQYDEDGDLILSRPKKGNLTIDVDAGGILKLIEANFKRNKELVKSKFNVMELNFLDSNWSSNLREKLKGVSVILAADVIYDDEVTNGFVNTVAQLFEQDPSRIAYVALEKRYVFTIANLDSVAPMYEEFLRCIARRKLNWSIGQIEIDFPQYFDYNRVEQMILMKICSKNDPADL